MRKQHLATYLKSSSTRHQMLSHEKSLQGAKQTHIVFVSGAIKSRAVIGHWQEITESFLNAMGINTAASRDFMPAREGI